MNKRLTTLAALLAAAAIVAIGCGSDDSSSDEPAPTKTAYVTEADGVCAGSIDDFKEITADLPGDVNAEESQEAITNEILPLYQEQLDELRGITPPEGDEDTTASIYDSLEEALKKIEDDPTAIGDSETFADANQEATDYGLEVCGS